MSRTFDSPCITTPARPLSFIVSAAQPVLIPVGLGLGVALYLGFYLQGLHFFDNDFDWINQARNTSWARILADLLRPIPADWGFQFRPGQVLGIKTILTLFGESASAFYTAKCLFAGIAAAGIATLVVQTGGSRQSSVTAAAVLGFSSTVFASTLWISDFELVAQTLTMAAIGVFWRAQVRHDETTGRWSGIGYQVAVVMLMVLAHRTKGSAKLLPVIFGIYLAMYHRDRFWRWAPALGVVALTILPVFAILDNPVPPFAPFSEDQSQGWMWKPANLETLSILVVGNAHPLFGTRGPEIAYSLLANLSPWLLWPALIAVVFALRETTVRALGTDPFLGLVSIWLVVAVLAYSAYPRLPEGFMARYVVVAFVPATLLVTRGLDALLRRFSVGRAAAGIALTLLVLGHGLTQAEGIRTQRDSLGQVIVTYDRARAAIAQDIDAADIVIIGFGYGYNRQRNDSNRYHIGPQKILAAQPQTDPLYVLIQSEQDIDAPRYDDGILDIQNSVIFNKPENIQLKVGIRPVATYHGLTTSTYDRTVYRSHLSFVGLLYQVTYEPVVS